MDPAAANGGKSGARQAPSGICAIGNGNSGNQNDQGGKGTNDDGIQKHFNDSKQSLLRGVLWLRAGMRHGGGAHAGFICKYAPGTAHPKRLHGCSDNSSGNSTGIHGSRHNLTKRIRNRVITDH